MNQRTEGIVLSQHLGMRWGAKRARSVATLSAVSMLALTACGAGERSAAAPVVRDSAGITIVENSAPLFAGAGGVRISDMPLLEIGVVEGAEVYQFDGVRGATRLSDGRIVIANGGSSELRYFDAHGQHLQSVGGSGGGPGEFQYMGAPLRLAGDSLLVGDRSARRVSIFDPEGSFVTSHSGLVPAGVLADGTILVLQADPMGAGGQLKSGLLRPVESVIHYTRSGEMLDTVGVIRGSERYLNIEQAGGTISSIEIRTLPFGRTQQFATARDHLYAGAADSYEIEVYRPGVGLERLIRTSRQNQEVTPAVIERLKEERLEATTTDAGRRDVERGIAETEFPKTMPAYGTFLVDAANNLWVAEYRAPGEEQPRWDLFDPEGRWLATVETPRRLRVVEIGVDYLLGVWRDEFDVEYLRLYGLVGSGGRG